MDDGPRDDTRIKSTGREGILPDPSNGRRVIFVDVESLKSAEKELEGALGFAAKVIVFRQGVGYGRHLADSMKKSMTISEMLNSLTKIAYLWGMGRMSVIPPARDPSSFPLRLLFTNCPFCGAEEKSKEPICNFLAGSIAGFFMSWSGSETRVKEVACRATGYQMCEFIVESSFQF